MSDDTIPEALLRRHPELAIVGQALDAHRNGERVSLACPEHIAGATVLVALGTSGFQDPPAAVPGLDDPGTADLGLDVLADGTAYIARAPSGANTSLYQLDASLAVVRELAELDDGLPKYNPFATDDQLSLWFTTDRANADEDILVATRTRPGDTWTSTPFIFDSALREGSPSLTADQLLVVWNALDASGDSNIYYATRRSPSDPWRAPSMLGPGVVSTTDGEAAPYVREDGCELFFSRFTGATPYDWNIYSVAIE